MSARERASTRMAKRSAIEKARRTARTAVALAMAIASAYGTRTSFAAPAVPAVVEPTANAAHNWPVSAGAAFRLLAYEPMEIHTMENAGAGVTGERRVRLHFSSNGMSLAAKWKPVPGGDLESWNNSPRKELSAYAVQWWFLDADELVVPTTVPRCIPLADYRRVQPDARATVPGSSCVLGVLSLWMRNVTVPDVLYDESRFFADPAYAYHMANFNLLTYLVDHRDGRAGNVLVSNDASNRRVFAVDNGISFDPWIYNFLIRNWNGIRVPRMRRAALERLRRLRPSDLRALDVVSELRLDGDGVLRLAEAGPNIDPARGTRVRDGVVQFGLTDGEINRLEERLARLLGQLGGKDLI